MQENNEQNKNLAENLNSVPNNNYNNSDRFVLDNFNNIKNLMNSGLMQEEQATKMIQNMLYGQKNQNQLAPTSLPDQTQTTTQVNNKYVDYVKNSGIQLNDADCAKLSGMMEVVASKAVEKFQQKLQHNATLISENDSAKKKLNSYAQNSNCEINMARRFTREEIGKMTRAEFDANEKQIMEQLSKGMIK